MKRIGRRMVRFPANKNPVCQLNRRKKIIECAISSSFPFFLFVFTCHCIFPLLLHFFFPIGNCYIVHYRILFHRLNMELTKYCSFIYLHTFHIHSQNLSLFCSHIADGIFGCALTSLMLLDIMENSFKCPNNFLPFFNSKGKQKSGKKKMEEGDKNKIVS